MTLDLPIVSGLLVLAALLGVGLAIMWLKRLAGALPGQLVSNNLEQYRSQLERDRGAELERLRATLQRIAIENQVRFSRLHDRRAEIIAEVYAKLDDLHHAFKEWSRHALMPGEDEHSLETYEKGALEKHNAFAVFYSRNAIWLDRKTCEAIDAILDTFRSSFLSLSTYAPPRQRLEALKEIHDKIPDARVLLERRFREMLGVEDGGRLTTGAGSAALGASVPAPASPPPIQGDRARPGPPDVADIAPRAAHRASVWVRPGTGLAHADRDR